MAIKFEKIQPGMELHDVHGLGAWRVFVVSVDAENRTAVVRWNGNREEKWYASRLQRLYAKLPPKYLEQVERQKAYRAAWPKP